MRLRAAITSKGCAQYNTELKTFPGLLWASTLYRSYKPMETFTVAEDLQKPPTVKF